MLSPPPQESIHRLVFEALGDGVLAFDEGRLIYANATACGLLGTDAVDALAGRAMGDVLALDADAPYSSTPAPGERSREVDGFLVRTEGPPLPALIQAAGVELDGRSVVVVFVRPTQDRQGEARSASAEARYQRFFERSLAGTYRSTVDGTILECNQSFAWLLGYETPQDIRKRSAGGLYPNAGARTGFLSRLLRDGVVSEEASLRRKDGSLGWFFDSAYHVPGEGGGEIEGTIVEITALKAAAESQQNAEERYRILFDLNPHPMWLYDIETGRFLAVNAAAVRTYGYSAREWTRMTIGDLLPPDDRRPEVVEIADFDEGRHVCKDGAVIRVELSGRRVVLGNRPARLVVATDVTERVAALEALGESERRFRLLFEKNPFPVWLFDSASLRLLEMNGPAVRLSGRTRSALLATTLRDLFPPSERQRVDETLAGASPAGIASVAMDGGDGTLVDLEATWHDVTIAGLPARLAITVDVTERNRMVRAIERAAREWTVTFDVLESPVVVLDPARRVRRLNRAALALARQEAFSGAVGLPLADLGDAEPWRAAAALAEAMAGRRETRTRRATGAGGRIWDVVVSSDPEQDTIAVVAHDATALSNLQDSLARAERLAAIGQLVGGVAHEVRNPLFGMTASLDHLEELSDDEDPGPYLRILRTQTERLAALMRDLLDYGGPPRLEIAPARFEVVIREAVADCARVATERSVRVVVEGDSGLPPVPMDRGRIGQVFRNLIENAIQHSPSGADVIVRCRVGADGERPRIESAVLDSGPGFSDEDLPQVFLPFFTKRRGGTGLGLSIVRRIVEEHGGNIAAGNRHEGGARIAFDLPLSSGTTAQTHR
jgi:PAS domain S-box-containing protein